MTEENLRKNSRETGAFPFLRRLTLCVRRGLIEILKSIMKRLCRRKRKIKRKKQSIETAQITQAEERTYIVKGAVFAAAKFWQHTTAEGNRCRRRMRRGKTNICTRAAGQNFTAIFMQNPHIKCKIFWQKPLTNIPK